MTLKDKAFEKNGNWYDLRDSKISVKTMDYNYSCFPCSLQVILSNITNLEKSSDIEEAWNDAMIAKEGSDLNTSAPTLDFIEKNIIAEKEIMAQKGIGLEIFKAEDFTSQKIAGTIATIMSIFQRYDDVGIICACENSSAHATVVSKIEGNSYFYYNPNPEADYAEFVLSELPVFVGLVEEKGLRISGLEKETEEIWSRAGDLFFIFYKK